jgi:hypothetical protein
MRPRRSPTACFIPMHVLQETPHVSTSQGSRHPSFLGTRCTLQTHKAVKVLSFSRCRQSAPSRRIPVPPRRPQQSATADSF